MLDIEALINSQQRLIRKQGAAIGAIMHILVKNNLVTKEDYINLENWFLSHMRRISALHVEIDLAEKELGKEAVGPEHEKVKLMHKLMEELEAKVFNEC